MKTYHKIVAIFLLSIFSFTAFAQNKDDAKNLVNQGTALHDEGKYEEAIAKYKEAIKADANYSTAYYELGYTLFNTGKSKDAIPYLENAIKLDPQFAGAYDILGSIYDDDQQFDKAIDYYRRGIKANPKYQMLYYNLSISCFRQGKYDEAETNAVQAIKLNPKHASSQRAYAMIAFKQKKRGISLLAWSSFLLLEPQTKRSAEAFNYIKYILNYGLKWTDEKSVTINVSTEDMEGPDFLMPMTVLSATSDKKGLTRIDSLTQQLKSLFEISENFAGKSGNAFYKSFFSDYLKKLGASDNMPAFAHLVSLTAYKEENMQWFKDNSTKLSALEAWVASTKREFE